MVWTRKHYALLLLLGAVLMPPGVVLLLMAFEWQASFSTDVRTEVLEVLSCKERSPRWYLTGTKIAIDDGTADDFSGSVQLSSHTVIRFERIGDGDLFVSVMRANVDEIESAALTSEENDEIVSGCRKDDENDGYSVAVLYDEEKRSFKRAVSDLVLEVSARDDKGARVLSFPFIGTATLGEVAHAQEQESMPMLLSGEVRVLGKTFGNELFEAGSVRLELGDRFQVPGKQSSAANGVVRLDEKVRSDKDTGMRVVYHSTGSRARIDRFGGVGFELKPSLWSRFSSDPIFAALAVFLIALIPSLVEAGFDRIMSKRDD